MCVEQCVSAIGPVEEPACVYLRSSCNYVTTVKGPKFFETRTEICHSICRGLCGCNLSITLYHITYVAFFFSSLVTQGFCSSCEVKAIGSLQSFVFLYAKDLTSKGSLRNRALHKHMVNRSHT